MVTKALSLRMKVLMNSKKPWADLIQLLNEITPGGGGGGMFGDGSDGAVHVAADDLAFVSVANADTFVLDVGATISPAQLGWIVIRAKTSIVINGTIDGTGLSAFIPSGKEGGAAVEHIGCSTPSGAGAGGGGGGGSLAPGDDAVSPSLGGALFNIASFLPSGGIVVAVPGVGGAINAPGTAGGNGQVAPSAVPNPSWVPAGKLYPSGWAGYIQGGIQGSLGSPSGSPGANGGNGAGFGGVGGLGGFGGESGAGGAAILLVAPDVTIGATGILRSNGAAGLVGAPGTVGADAAALSTAGGGGGGSGGPGGNGGCGGPIMVFTLTAAGLTNLGTIQAIGGLGGLGSLGAAGGLGDGGAGNGGAGGNGAAGCNGTPGIVITQALT